MNPEPDPREPAPDLREREAFEKWMQIDRPSLMRHVMTYADQAEIQAECIAWIAWRARAALALPVHQSAPAALRYQWLREHFHGADFMYGEPGDEISVITFRWPPAPISADLDASIDAALAQSSPVSPSDSVSGHQTEGSGKEPEAAGE